MNFDLLAKKMLKFGIENSDNNHLTFLIFKKKNFELNIKNDNNHLIFSILFKE